jgi:2-hydroxy-3-oxopropionate reductase
MPVEVAQIGAGIMGSAIGTRLLECGHKLHVFDLDAPWPAKGGRAMYRLFML